MVNDWVDGRATKITVTYQEEEEARFEVYDDGRVRAYTDKGLFGWKAPEVYHLDSTDLEKVVDPIFSEADQATGIAHHKTQNRYGVEVEYLFNPEWSPDSREVKAVWDDISVENYPEVLESFSTLLGEHPEAETGREIFEDGSKELQAFVNTVLEETEDQKASTAKA
ncbi:MAG: hypothetical protein ACLFRK_01890 [Candidatus Nanohaloarchaea archaeon]